MWATLEFWTTLFICTPCPQALTAIATAFVSAAVASFGGWEGLMKRPKPEIGDPLSPDAMLDEDGRRFWDGLLEGGFLVLTEV